MEYCKVCAKKTETVYNDFMVSFCAECHTMRGNRADYTGQRQPFKCLHCGRITDESYTGQSVCLICQIVNGIDDTNEVR